MRWATWTAALALSLSLGALSLGAAGASAQDAFPSRPVKLISPFEPGGGSDVTARVFAEGWGKQLGQRVIVENHLGAAGAIGADIVAKSKPDGYTVCWCTNSQTVILPLIDPNLAYDPKKDLKAISTIYAADGAIVVRNDLGVNTLKEFAALAKTSPGKYTYGSGGIGTIVHLAGALFANKAGIELKHVPYKGEQYGVNDLIGGRIDMFPLSIVLSAQMGEAGQLKVLAVRGSERSPLMPNVPTIAEAGYPGAESPILTGLYVAGGTPDPLIQKLYAASAAALKDPDVRQKMLAVGGRIIGEDPVETQAGIKADTEKWSAVVKSIGFSKK